MFSQTYTVHMDTNELLALNAEGLIPGPGESEPVFRERVQAVRSFFQKQPQLIPPHQWHWASEQLNALFDFSPRWCAATLSSKDLAPWQAAATWIDVKRIYMIQLKPARWVSWLIDRDELLAHEAAHAARAAFDEPKTEEIFAYMTSSARWRQVIGPLIRHPKEALLLLGFVMAGVVSQFAETVWDFQGLSACCFMGAAVACLYWSVRLLRMRLQLKRASQKILPYLKDSKHVRAVLFRLTDDEICRLAHGKRIGNDELRWQLLKTYFKSQNGLF